MSPQYALLAILNNKPSHGYALKRRYDAFFGKEKPLAFGQIYASLARLSRDKRIITEASATPDQPGGPERRKYAITPEGRNELQAWLQMPEELRSDSRPVLFAKVVAAILVDSSPDVYLDQQRASHIAQMRQLTEARRSGNLAQSLQADYALFHLEADLRWIDLTSARLQSLTEEIHSEQ
jgi:DNA-binding PadR family transcriptional regulator